MTRAAVVAGLLLVGGCNQIFGLEPGRSGGDDGGGDGGDGGDGGGDDGGDGGDGGGGEDSGIDGQPCTSAFDEDSDGVPDDCDICPHVVNVEQLDEDGDRVGTACDPDPGGVNRIVFFDGFSQPGLPGWVMSGPTWGGVLGGFAAQTDPELASAYMLRDGVVPPRALVDTGMVIDAFADAAADNVRGLGVFFHATTVATNGAPDGFECQVQTDELTSVTVVRLLRWSTGQPELINMGAGNTPIEENGRYNLAEGQTASTMRCLAGFDNPGGVLGTTAAVAESPRGTALALRTRHLSARWAYVIVIDRPDAP